MSEEKKDRSGDISSCSKRRGRGSFISLRFAPGRLYGREYEESTLRDVYRRVVQQQKISDADEGNGELYDNAISIKKEIVLIFGSSGTGKTALAQTLNDRARKRNDYFVSGKFAMGQRSIPYAAIVEALAELSEQITDRDEIFALRDELGEEMSRVIARIVPALARKDILSLTAFSDNEGRSPSPSRAQFNFAFRSFFRHLCERNNKTCILFIDDLQWADAASLELLEVLATDQDNANLLIVGSYRDDEVEATDPLLARIREIERSNRVNINRLSITNLEQHVVNELVADTLNMSIDDTRQLSHLVHQKTHGNVFYVIKFMKISSLFRDIFYSEKSLTMGNKEVKDTH